MITPRFIQKGVSLAAMTTLGVGGDAALFTAPRSIAALVAALEWANTKGVPYRILGGGSNVVIADTGLDELIIRPEMEGQVTESDGSDVLIECEAGLQWDALVATDPFTATPNGPHLYRKMDSYRRGQIFF